MSAVFTSDWSQHPVFLGQCYVDLNLNHKLLEVDTVTIIVHKIPVYCQVLAFLVEIKQDYHTFMPKHVKPLSFVLRGLSIESPLEEILDELSTWGITYTQFFKCILLATDACSLFPSLVRRARQSKALSL